MQCIQYCGAALNIHIKVLLEYRVGQQNGVFAFTSSGCHVVVIIIRPVIHASENVGVFVCEQGVFEAGASPYSPLNALAKYPPQETNRQYFSFRAPLTPFLRPECGVIPVKYHG